MKRFLFSLMIALIMSVTVFCQVPDDSLKTALEALGLSPALALIVSVAILTFVGQVLPQKWAAPLLWLEKLFYALWVGLHSLNEKSNNLSKSQKRAKIAMQIANNVENAAKSNAKKGVMSVIILLLLSTFALQAQSPWKGFFKPVTQDVVYSHLAVKGTQDATAGSVWLFRPSAALTAMAIDFKEKPVLSKSLSSVGFGLSYGKFTNVDDKAYCTWSANALLLTSIKIGDVESTAFGGAVTVDVFNKFLGAGIGYIDKGFMLLTTISVSF